MPVLHEGMGLSNLCHGTDLKFCSTEGLLFPSRSASEGRKKKPQDEYSRILSQSTRYCSGTDLEGLRRDRLSVTSPLCEATCLASRYLHQDSSGSDCGKYFVIGYPGVCMQGQESSCLG